MLTAVECIYTVGFKLMKLFVVWESTEFNSVKKIRLAIFQIVL